MKKPNVLLVIPRYLSTKECGYIMPMGILYVSSALKMSDVAHVFTVNLNHCHDDDETVLQRIIAENHIDIVGSGGISGQFIEIYPLFELIRKINPELTIIIGGGMVTSDPITTMKAFNSLVDYGVIGEGEITVPELISAIHHCSPMENVKGIIYRNGEGWMTTDSRIDIDDLDSIPIPDYTSFDYDKYLATNGETEDGVKYSPVAIIGGRSCKYNCTFCFHPTGSRYRQRSLDSIFLEIDFLLQRYEINYIALREELFASDISRVLEFCERMKMYPVVWSIQLRVDSVSREMVDALKRSNCRYVFLGIESADNRILKSMRKQITIEQVEYALDLMISAGLDTRSTIILGDMVETVESAQRTIDWWLKHRKYSSIAIDMIIAFPGSWLYQKARENGRISSPEHFLKDGCPIINLSCHLNDDEYENLVERISYYNHVNYQIYKYN